MTLHGRRRWRFRYGLFIGGGGGRQGAWGRPRLWAVSLVRQGQQLYCMAEHGAGAPRRRSRQGGHWSARASTERGMRPRTQRPGCERKPWQRQPRDQRRRAAAAAAGPCRRPAAAGPPAPGGGRAPPRCLRPRAPARRPARSPAPRRRRARPRPRRPPPHPRRRRRAPAPSASAAGAPRVSAGSARPRPAAPGARPRAGRRAAAPAGRAGAGPPAAPARAALRQVARPAEGARRAQLAARARGEQLAMHAPRRAQGVRARQARRAEHTVALMHACRERFVSVLVQQQQLSSAPTCAQAGTDTCSAPGRDRALGSLAGRRGRFVARRAPRSSTPRPGSVRPRALQARPLVLRALHAAR